MFLDGYKHIAPETAPPEAPDVEPDVEIEPHKSAVEIWCGLAQWLRDLPIADDDVAQAQRSEIAAS